MDTKERAIPRFSVNGNKAGSCPEAAAERKGFSNPAVRYGQGTGKVPNKGGAMTTAEREVLAFIELNRLVAKGTLRDRFPNCDLDEVLSQLKSAGLVSYEMRPTIQGEHPFYKTKEHGKEE